jgi:UDP-perosamine 4-acetyltransferase
MRPSIVSDRIIVLGAGGHARVAVAALRACGMVVEGCLALHPPRANERGPAAYLGSDDVLDRLNPLDVMLVNGVGSTGSTSLRQRVFANAKERGFRFLSLRHPQSFVEEGVVLSEGVQLMAGAVLQVGTSVGANTVVNTGAVIDHDCRIGAHVHVCPGVTFSGTVTVGDGAHIGIGATILQGVRIGEGALIGAGAVVVHDVAAGSTVVGVPARPVLRR